MTDFLFMFAVCTIILNFIKRTVATSITFHANAAFKYCTGFNISDFTAIAPVYFFDI